MTVQVERAPRHLNLAEIGRDAVAAHDLVIPAVENRCPRRKRGDSVDCGATALAQNGRSGIGGKKETDVRGTATQNNGASSRLRQGHRAVRRVHHLVAKSQDRARRIVHRHVGREIHGGRDGMAAGMVIDRRRIVPGLQGDRARAADHIGNGGVGEGHGIQAGIRVERYQAAAIRPEGRAVIDAERAVETRGAAIGIPVREVRPVAVTPPPCRLSGVDQSGDRQEVGADRRGGSCQRRVIPVDDRDHIREDPHPLIGAEGQKGVAGGSLSQIGYGGKREVIAGVSRLRLHCHTEPGRVAHADQAGLNVGVADMDGLQSDIGGQERSRRVIIDIDCHRACSRLRSGTRGVNGECSRLAGSNIGSREAHAGHGDRGTGGDCGRSDATCGVTPVRAREDEVLGTNGRPIGHQDGEIGATPGDDRVGSRTERGDDRSEFCKPLETQEIGSTAAVGDDRVVAWSI